MKKAGLKEHPKEALTQYRISRHLKEQRVVLTIQTVSMNLYLVWEYFNAYMHFPKAVDGTEAVFTHHESLNFGGSFCQRAEKIALWEIDYPGMFISPLSESLCSINTLIPPFHKYK